MDIVANAVEACRPLYPGDSGITFLLSLRYRGRVNTAISIASFILRHQYELLRPHVEVFEIMARCVLSKGWYYPLEPDPDIAAVAEHKCLWDDFLPLEIDIW